MRTSASELTYDYPLVTKNKPFQKKIHPKSPYSTGGRFPVTGGIGPPNVRF